MSIDISRSNESMRFSIDPYHSLAKLFDGVVSTFREGNSSYSAMTDLVDGLSLLHNQVPRPQWIAEARSISKSHPISRFVYQCPFTSHSATKPRGYSGDAELIDFIYRHPASDTKRDSATQLGQIVLLHNTDSPAPAAVRARRHLTASYISELLRTRPGVHIMSVACGHARELELLDDATCARFGRFVAYDQDPESLKEASKYAARKIPIEVVEGTIVQLLKNNTLVDFDLIFSAGLYDYLSDRLAAKLTNSLFARLRPGGKLIVANFLPHLRDIAYMEIFMDWKLTYRDENGIRSFAQEIEPSEIAKARYFVEPNRNVGFLELTKTSQ